MIQAFHNRTKRLDYWDIKMSGLGTFAIAILLVRVVPELIDINPWWWAILTVLLFLRPFYHFWISPSPK